MNCVLNLSEDDRVLSAGLYKITPEGATVVTTLPEGDISNYLYINNEYVYDPLLEPSPIEPEEGNVI